MTPPYNLVRIDQGLAEEAKELAVEGRKIGAGIHHIIYAIDQRRDLSVSKLQDMFDEILEGVCEAAYSEDPAAYNIINAQASYLYRPSAHPNGEPGAREKLDDALETYASISQEDAEAELADQR